MTSTATATAVAALMALAGSLHYVAGFALPRPWPDESHFIAPAIALVRDATLAVPALNAPEGIFWMPAGYYFLQVPMLALGMDGLVAARLLALAGVVTFAAAAAAAAARAGANRWVALAAVAAWLCFPRVVAISNIARMEGLILGLAGVSLWLTARGRWPAAVGVSLLAPLIHPVGSVVTVAVVAATAVGRGSRPWSVTDRMLLAIAAVLWLLQLLYFALHADIAATHLGFQLARKAGRAVAPLWWQWLLLVAIAAAGVASTKLWARRAGPERQALWIALALAGAFVVVDMVGREMWYQPLGRETAILLVVLVAAATAPPRLTASWSEVAATVVATAAVVAAAIGLQATLVRPWYGMRASAASRAEWHAFTDAGIAALQRFDAAAGAPATVLIDPFSGFGQEVFAHEWRRLRFVQPTPATPRSPLDGDYVLATPGAPFVTTRLVDRWGEPELEVVSQRQRYRLQLLKPPDG